MLSPVLVKLLFIHRLTYLAINNSVIWSRITISTTELTWLYSTVYSTSVADPERLIRIRNPIPMLIWTPEPNSYVDTDSEPNSYVDTDPKPNFLCWYADPEPNFLCWYADPEPNFFIRIWSRIWISLTVVTVCRKTLKLYGFWRSYNQDPQRWL